MPRGLASAVGAVCDRAARAVIDRTYSAPLRLMNTRPPKRKSIILVSLLLALLSFSAVSVDRLKTDVTWLADPAREGRYAGSPAARAAADYIAAKFKESGFDVQMQDFGAGRRNVVARSGTAERYVLIGAHYDGQGPGMPSASDNAAGIAVTLEVARELKSRKIPLAVVAVAFDDEEQGLNGSRYYTDHPIYPLDQAQVAVIFDTMGRQFLDLSSWTLFVLGSEYSSELATVMQKRAGPDMLIAGSDLIGPRSDFAPFAVKRVPYLFFTHATHKDYHGTGDTADRVNYSRLAKDAGLVARIIEDIAHLPKSPTYLQQPVYPVGETNALSRELDLVQKERNDVPAAYRLMFEDFRARLRKDDSREVRRVAATALLALATPRLSSFMLTFILGPYYEHDADGHETAAAIYEEALKWTEDASTRSELQEKIESLRAVPVR
jgi:hypothetical protein